MRFTKSCLLLTLPLSTAFSSANEITKEELVGIEHVTVYGSASPISQMQYPGQISVVDAEQIAAINPSSMSDLLRDIPGLEFSGGPRRTGESPSIRGRGGENVLILLDGARQSFISAHDGRLFLDPELVKVAEVVKGPASSLYGSGAVGGVLAFDTLDAKDLLALGETTGAKFKIGYQGANDDTLASVTGFGVTEQFDFLANISTRSSGAIDLGSGAKLSSDDDIRTGLFKIGTQLSSALNLDFSWQGFRNEAIEPNNGQGLNESDNDVNKTIKSNNARLGLTYAPEDSSYINAKATFYQTNSEVTEFDPSLPRTTVRDIETQGLSLRNTSEFNFDDWDVFLTLGADWYEDEQRGTDTNTESGLRGGVPNGKARFLGTFAEATFTFNSPLGLPGELLFVPGFRYDRFKSEGGNSAAIESSNSSPRIAFTYSPTEFINLFANYSEGFRAPSLNELFLDGVHFSVPHPTLFDPTKGQFVFVNNNFIANTELEPEFSESREIGVSFEYAGLISSKDLLQSKFSYYDSDIENLIDLNVSFAYDASCFTPPFFPCSAGTSSSQNIQSAEISGFELETFYRYEDLSVTMSYSRIDGMDNSTGSDLGSLTPDRLNIDAKWDVSGSNDFIGLRMHSARSFVREQFNNESQAFEIAEQRAGYAVFDLYGQWQPEEAKGLKFSLGIDNLFDKAYERVFEGVYAKGRNVKFTVSYQFSS